MDDFDFVVVSKAETVTRYDLRYTFYKRNRFRRYEWDGTSQITASKPLALKRESSIAEDTLRAQYGQNYYVLITQGLSVLSGPHKGQLFLQILGQEDALWLGTKQFEGNFFDDKGLLKQLRIAIKGKEYWMSDDSEDEEIEMKAAEDIVDLQTEPLILLPLRTKFKQFRIMKLAEDRHVPKCPLCKVRKNTLRGLKGHFRNAHGKLLIFSYQKPIDKCPPM